MSADAMELIAAAVTGTLFGGAVKPLLAPFDALAEEWKLRVRTRLRRADEQARAMADGQPVIVNERVAFKALLEAASTDDPTVTTYLAGVLAGVSDANDDDPASVLAQIGRLSSGQLLLHFSLYRALHELVRLGSAVACDLSDPDQLQAKYTTYVPAESLVTTLGLDSGRQGDLALISSLRALAREGLIAAELTGRNWRVLPGYLLGDADVLADSLVQRYAEPFPSKGIIFAPTPAGIEFLLWGTGQRGSKDPDTLRALESKAFRWLPSTRLSGASPVQAFRG